MSAQDHWNRIYSTKSDQDVSWFEPLPEVSVRMMEAAGLNAQTCVYSPDLLAAELGSDLTLVESIEHTHITPWGATQSFQYSRLVATRGGDLKVPVHLN